MGVWLDQKFGISPLFILLGLGVGLFMAFYGTYHMLVSLLGRGKDGEDD